MLQKVKLAVRDWLSDEVVDREVEAHIYGKLAVHHAVTRSGEVLDTWRITHIPSGASVTRGLAFREACDLARAAQSLDWDFGIFGDRTQTLKEMPKATSEGFPRLHKKHCDCSLGVVVL